MVLVEALRAETLVRDEDLAVELARRVTLKAIPAGTVLITQNAVDRDLFLILSGKCSVIVNGRVVASRSAGEHVGEMALELASRLRDGNKMFCEPEGTTAASRGA